MTSIPTKDLVLKSCLDSLNTCIDIIQNHSTDAATDFDQIKSIAKDLSEAEIGYEKHALALQKTEAFYNENPNCQADVNETLVKELKSTSSKTNFNKHKIYTDVLDKIGEGHQNTNRQSFTDDQSIICSTTFTIPVDPLSKKPVKDPCVNQVCNHVYEYENIMAYIRTNKHKVVIKCPVVGCVNNCLQSKDLIRDEALKEVIEEKLSQLPDDEAYTDTSVVE